MLFGSRATEKQPFNMASIPQDCVSEILSYLPEGGGATRQFRTEKPHIKDYLNAFRMKYTSSNLKYFNWLYERKDPRDVLQRRIGLPIKLVPAPPKSVRHQCCALTTKGARCKNKTFGLFCSRHEGATTCYWCAPRFTPPSSTLPPPTCPVY